jgi:dTDP-4-amino-4,6-dideoxygalactose transaminase
MKEKSKIWLSSPHIGENEIKYINSAFESNWIAPLGPNVDAFEYSIQQQVGVAHAAALSSGTAAINLALILLDVKLNDYVFCQSMTFSASANPILYQGAIPVFIDSEKDTWNMDPELLREALKDAKNKNKLPKAIIPVHLYGMPSRIVEIVEIANEYEVPVIEDSAESIGSYISNKQCGSFGKFGVLLERTQKKLNEANSELDKLVGVRTRIIQRKLKEVQELPEGESTRYLEE